MRAADAICGAVEKIGALLAEHFPIKPHDTDELQNVIVEKWNPYIPKGMDLSSWKNAPDSIGPLIS